MPNLQPVLFIVGVLFTILSAFMTLPIIADILDHGSGEYWVFVFCGSLGLVLGLILIFTQRQEQFTRLDVRQAFLVTALSWVSLAFVSALPFYVSPTLELSFTDAFFEATSGLTTTGSTVLSELDAKPWGILMWRSLLQWLGGIGIVVTALVVLPMLQVGGMQLFRVEFAERMEKTLPRPAQIGFSIILIYTALTGLCALLYWMCDMSIFDAINHAMTTVSTGGYSTHDTSLGWFDDSHVLYVAVLFMILGSLPFLLFFEAARGNIKSLLLDSQVLVFLSLLLGAVVTLFVYLYYSEEELTLIDVLFNVTSIFTGTGYSSRDYAQWGSFAVLVFFFVMMVGGCSGSTACGLKVFRLQVLYAAARLQILRLTRPHAVFIIGYQGQNLSEEVVQSVMGFFFLYVVTFAVLAVLIGASGVDFITATSSAVTAIANVGPGLGNMVGPSHNFSTMPMLSKWLMSFGMIIGRLELFTIYVLFTVQFWRR